MLKSYLTAALRNLARSKFYAVISIVGLAIGIWAVLTLALLLRNQYSFDRFIPSYERIYLAVSVLQPANRAPDYQMESHGCARGPAESELSAGAGDHASAAGRRRVAAGRRPRKGAHLLG